MRRVAALSAIALVLLSAGCGKPAADGASRGVAGLDSGSSAGSDALAGLPSGLVTFVEKYSEPTSLMVYEITTGKMLGTVEAPNTADVTRRETFDATMSRLAYVHDCKLVVATLIDARFMPTATWEPPQEFSAGAQCFRRPTFRADGRLWATLSPSNDDAGKMMSVDAADPNSPLRDEGAGSPRKQKVLRIADLPEKAEAQVYARGDQIESVRPAGWQTTGSPRYEFSYDCRNRLDDVRLVCTTTNEQKDQYYGSIAVVTIDWAAGAVTVKQVAPAARPENVVVLPARDGKQILIGKDAGWYTVGADGGGAPAPQPLGPEKDIGKPLFWH